MKMEMKRYSYYTILGMMAGMGFARVADALFPPEVTIFSYTAGALYVGIALAFLHYDDFICEQLGVKNETT